MNTELASETEYFPMVGSQCPLPSLSVDFTRQSKRSRRRPIAGHPCPTKGALLLLQLFTMPLLAHRDQPIPRHPEQQAQRIPPWHR